MKKQNKRTALSVLYRIDRKPVAQKDVSFGSKESLLMAKLILLAEKLRRSIKEIGPVRRPVRRPVRIPREKSAASWKTVAYIMASAAAGLAVCAAAVLLVMNLSTTNVTINDSGRVIKANTTEETVGELLTKNGITLDDNDILEVSLSAKLQEDMEIVIRRANTVTISDEDGDTQIKMLAGTVGEALERAGIRLGSKDEVYPAESTYVYGGMKINIVRVEVKYETQQEVLEYSEITKESKDFKKGDRILMQRGKDGLQEHTIEIVYKNGKEYSRELIDTTVISEPVDEEIYIGTYVESTPEPTKQPEKTKEPEKTKAPEKTKEPEKTKAPEKTKEPEKAEAPEEDADTGADNEKDDDGKLTKVPSIEQIHSGTWKEHAAVPAPASSLIAKTITAKKVTAYAPTGNKTATGTWPRIGTVAANPKQVPYGTKIYVPGYGYGRIEDTGSNKHPLTDYLFDVFFETEAECRKWGVKRGLKVYILK